MITQAFFFEIPSFFLPSKSSYIGKVQAKGGTYGKTIYYWTRFLERDNT
jgi:hypothetical protein